jgi:GntR family transcriptional regulator
MIKQIPPPSMASRAANDLRKAIRQGSYSVDGRLPPEPVLSQQLGVSRGTTREAVAILEQEGFLYRRQGAGTFVLRALSGLTNNLNANFGVTEVIVAAGKTPGTIGILVSEQGADAQMARSLGLAPGDPVIRIDRTRTANASPVAHTRDFLSRALLKAHGLETVQIDSVLNANQSLYDTLRDKGIVVRHGVAELTPVAIDGLLAKALEIAPGTLLFRIDQVDYDRDGQPVLLSVEHLVAGAFTAQVYRRGPG